MSNNDFPKKDHDEFGKGAEPDNGPDEAVGDEAQNAKPYAVGKGNPT